MAATEEDPGASTMPTTTTTMAESETKCNTCDMPKTKGDFSGKQWKKSATTRKCRDCIDAATKTEDKAESQDSSNEQPEQEAAPAVVVEAPAAEPLLEDANQEQEDASEVKDEAVEPTVVNEEIVEEEEYVQVIENVVEDVVVDQPATDEATEDAVVEEAVVEEPAVQEPTIEETVVEETIVVETVVEEAATEDNVVEEITEEIIEELIEEVTEEVTEDIVSDIVADEARPEQPPKEQEDTVATEAQPEEEHPDDEPQKANREADLLKQNEEEKIRQQIEEEARQRAAQLKKEKEEEQARARKEALARAQAILEEKEEEERAAIEEAARKRAAEVKRRREEEQQKAAEAKRLQEEEAKAAEERRQRLEAEAERLAKAKEARLLAEASRQRMLQEEQDRRRAREIAEAKANADAYNRPPMSPVADHHGNHEAPKTAPRPVNTSMTFADAFSNHGGSPREPLFTPREVSTADTDYKTPKAAAASATPVSNQSHASQKTTASTETNMTSVSEATTGTNATNKSDATPDTTSFTALGARKSKKVSNRMNAYLEQARKNKVSELPPDKIPIPSASPVGVRKLAFTTPSSPTSPTSKAHLRSKTPPQQRRSSTDLSTIRAKFSDNSNPGQPNTQFVYGEAFRQKQRTLKQAAKIKDKEAVSVARGFDVMVLDSGKAEMGEVDATSLDKTFVFQGDSEVQLHNGECKIDYANTSYEAFVFLVHRTRGLLLLKQSINPETPRYVVPGGALVEKEFLSAAKLTGHESVQLQLAGREGAARELHHVTGIDVRAKLERLKPAVLRTEAIEHENKILLKNENSNKLYYFLQVEENDFPTESVEGKTLRGPVDEPDVTNSALRLLLDDDVEGFRFAREPQEAAEYLKQHDDGKSSIALSLVMNQASDTPVPDVQVSPMAQGDAKHVPKEFKKEESDRPFDEKENPESALELAQEKFDLVKGDGAPNEVVANDSGVAAAEAKTAPKGGLGSEPAPVETGLCCACVVQ